jgi:hypothetical protein
MPLNRPKIDYSMSFHLQFFFGDNCICKSNSTKFEHKILTLITHIRIKKQRKNKLFLTKILDMINGMRL